MKHSLLLVTFSIFLISCNSERKPFSKSWTPVKEKSLYYSGSPLKIVDLTNSLLDVVTAASFIDLQEDGTFSLNLGNYQYGKWELEEDYVILHNQYDGIDSLKVKTISNDSLVFSMSEGGYTNYHTFTGAENANASETNPFLLENNQWRIRPEGSETAQQLKDRLLNHLKYKQLYYTFVEENKIKYVDSKVTPSPINVTNSGLRPKRNDELSSSEWPFFFHDKQECEFAQDLLSTAMKGIKRSDIPFGSRMERLSSVYSVVQNRLESFDCSTISQTSFKN